MSRFSDFMRHLRFKYRVSIFNELTLHEVWHGRLSRFMVFVWGGVLLSLTFFLMALLIMLTPLRHYLPGYGDSSSRNYLLNDAVRVDSLSYEVARQQAYISMLQSVLSGQVSADSVPPIDSVVLIDNGQLASKSEAERNFIEQYEEEEKYNLNSRPEAQENHLLVFRKPAKGVVSGSFRPDSRQYGISIATPAGEPVLSVLGGTVIHAGFTFDSKWVIVVQHQGGYLSVYKNNARLYKRVGDHIHAGETIAIAGDATDQASGRQLVFELWKEGTPIDPETVIAF